MLDVSALLDRWWALKAVCSSAPTSDWDDFLASAPLVAEDHWWITKVGSCQLEAQVLQELSLREEGSDLHALARAVVDAPDVVEPDVLGEWTYVAADEATTSEVAVDNRSTGWLDADSGLYLDTPVDEEKYRRVVDDDERAALARTCSESYESQPDRFRERYGPGWEENWLPFLLQSWSDSAVPVYRRRRLKQVAPGREGELDPELRMLNRIARTARITRDPVTGEPVDTSPHIAAAVDPRTGKVMLAGNTGAQKHVVQRGRDAEGSRRVVEGMTGTSDLSSIPDRRLRKDIAKLRAAGERTYQEAHPEARLADIVAALENRGDQWFNVGKGGRFVIHGEMTLLGEILEAMKDRPAPTGGIERLFIGGNMACCLPCYWTIELFNEHVAGKLGYAVSVSGTHGEMYPGWTFPDWARRYPVITQEVVRRANERGWILKKEEGRLVLKAQAQVPDDEHRKAQPLQESDSDWEDDSGGTRADRPRRPKHRGRGRS